MTAQPVDPADDWDDLPLDDEDSAPAPKKKAVPLRRTAAQQARIDKKAAEAEAARQLAAANTAAQRQAQMLAQIVNLHIAGFSLSDIGAQIGATADEVDRMLANEAARYVRNQPALRTYVRNFLSAKYSGLLDAVWDQAVDKTHGEQLNYVDRAQRILAQMGRLHGAEAPTQTEVKVESTPEAIDKLVSAISAAQGMGYDTDIFDVEYTETVHEAVEQSAAALEVSGNAVEESDGHDEL